MRRHRSALCESPAEEIASAVTHGFGAILAVAAFAFMLFTAAGDPVRLLSSAAFGGSLVLLYVASTLYHAVSAPRWKEVLQVFDHACIYLLIAGSYTPLSLVALRGAWGWSLFGIVWFLALAGVLVKTLSRGRKDHWISTALYLLMGWLAVVALGPILRALPPAGFAWLLAGGLCYTLGVVFFVWQRLRFNHAIWHLFVLAGSACHVVAALRYILP